MSRPGAVIVEGHVQGLSNTRSLGEMGVPVYVVDNTNCIARYSKYCQKFFKSPDFNTDQFVDFLVDLAEEENIRDWVLVPSNDHAVYTISKHKKRLEAYYKLISPALEVINQIYDKVNLVRLATKIGIPVPITQTFRDKEEFIKKELSFPVLTKGRNGLSFYKSIGKKALLAQNSDELQIQLAEIEEIIPIEQTFTQELIPFDGSNKTISFTAFCIDGDIKAHWTGVKLREHPAQFGTATFTKSIYVKECHEQAVPLLKKLKYTGVCEVEYLQDPRDKKYKLIEINPRTWLWVGLAKACGIDYAKMIYHHVNDLPFVYPKQYDTDRYWINPITDIVFAFIAALKGKLNVSAYFASIVNKGKTNALMQKGDMKPALAYMIQLFTFIKSR